MSEQVGKIIQKRNLFPGPEIISTNTVGGGLRKVLNLCFSYRKFCPRNPGHCKIAQAHFDFCNQNHIGTIMYRCAFFEPKEGVQVSAVDGKKTATEFPADSQDVVIQLGASHAARD